MPSVAINKPSLSSWKALLGALCVLTLLLSPGPRNEIILAKTNHSEGAKAIRAGYYDRAVKIFLEAVKKDPKDIDAHNGAALAYLKLQQSKLCYDQAREVIRLDPSNARAHALSGLALLRSGFLNAAALELVAAINLNPKESYAWEGSAEIDYYNNRPKEARQKAGFAAQVDPSEPDPWMTYARASSRLELFSEAADAYEKFLLVTPKSDTDRRDRIRGLISFYRRLTGLHMHVTSGPKYVDIPFRLGPDRRPYLDVQLNGREATFVLDTGSGFTVLSEEAAAKFGVPALARGGTSQGVGGNGKFPIVYGLINSLRLGPEKVEQVPCFIRHFHNTQNMSAGEQADGFIGLSVISNFIAGLDYKNQSMWLAHSVEDIPAANVAAPDAPVVPFRTTQNGLISIETRIDDTNDINAIVDSGASSTVISSAAVTRLKMSDSIIKGQTVQVVGAAGISDNVELLMIHNCKVAGLQEDNLRALVLDFGAINETSGFEQSGILGGDFLMQFKVIIDFARGQMTLEPQTKTVIRTPPPAAMN
ncbi:MAG TPA: aspartyl protease family protein [Blastocatellia bacterium]|nr:aspartyl protease family protein [Blastocatellia bacterium]